MKKILLSILLILLFPAYSFSTVYYGGAASKNVNANDLWYEDVTGSCAGTGSPVASATVLQAGNTIYANGCAITVNVNFTIGTISNAAGADAQSVAGGDFDVATSVTPLTITATTIEGGGTGAAQVLHVTGNANANPALTITATNINGGSVANSLGVNDAHTVGTVVVNGPVTITGGSNGTAKGYSFTGSSGAVSITGNAIGATAPGLVLASSGTASITGNCTGSSTVSSNQAAGCYANSSGSITVNGSIINGTRDVGAIGTIIHNPGVQDYFKSNGGGTAVYLAKPPAGNKILSDASYVESSTGTYTAGTATATGGGGAWSF